MNTWGIWGLGTVGKSVIRHLHSEGHVLTAFDSRKLTEEEMLFLKKYQVILYSDLTTFLRENTYIVPSPGIDTSVAPEQSKMVQELDLFCSKWRKQLIGITGSLGKTTLVTVIDQILRWHSIPCSTGGNIGTAMLDLLGNDAEYALLELSSFQLEKAHCIPSIAVLTNLYPNHLDRHGSLESYFEAKYQLFKYQTEEKAEEKTDQKALVPLTMLSEFRKRTDRPLAFFSVEYPREITELQQGDAVYTLGHTTLIKISKQNNEVITRDYCLSPSTIETLKVLLPETRLLVLSLCDLLEINVEDSALLPQSLEIPGHRIECIGTYQGRSFYNDSKSTIMEATLAAVAIIKEPTHLLLGGLSKGVDRTEGLQKLKNCVASITCFGKEAEQLLQACIKVGIPATSHQTLELALMTAMKASEQNEAILLSPGGTSYDLYRDYKERGEHFKQLVHALKKKSSEELF